MKIAIFGMGGIGGAIGGALAHAFPEDITFIARGERGRVLAEKGLAIHGDFLGEYVARPALVTENPADAGIQDAIFICVKMPDLAAAAEAVRPMVGNDTLIVAAMNGLLAAKELQKIYPENPVTQALLYVVALKGPDFGIIQKGKLSDITMSALGGNEKAARLTEMMNEAGWTAKLTDDIDTVLWDKYVFNCAFNTMTAALSCKAGFLKEEAQLSDFKAIVAEGIAAAHAVGVDFDYDMAGKAEYKLIHTGRDSDSSLARDFAAGRKGEMEMFSGDLIRIGEEKSVKMPVLTRYYEMLKEKSKSF